MSKEKKEIEVKEAGNSTAIQVYQEPQFNDLNKAIESLGKYSGKLDKEEKKIGYDILNEWEKNVIERISDKAKQLEAILQFFGIKDQGRWYSMESSEYEYMKDRLSEVSNTQVLYDKYKDIKLKIQEHKLKQPTRPVTNPNISIIANDEAYAEYDKELIKWNSENKRLTYDKTKAKLKWIKD